MPRPALLLPIATLLVVLAAAAHTPASLALPARHELAARPAVRQAGAPGKNGTRAEPAKKNDTTKKKEKPLMQGVGGGFIVLAIATTSLALLHFLLHGVSKRTAELLEFSESEHSFSEVWTTTQNPEDPRGSDSVRAFGRRLRESFSFNKPDGSWVHEDSE